MAPPDSSFKSVSVSETVSKSPEELLDQMYCDANIVLKQENIKIKAIQKVNIRFLNFIKYPPKE